MHLVHAMFCTLIYVVALVVEYNIFMLKCMNVLKRFMD